MPRAFALSLSLSLYWEIQRATGNERKWWNAEEEYLFESNEHNLPFIEYEETQYRNFKGTFFLFQRGKGSLNSKRRISESLFILKMFRRRLRQLFSLRESVVSSFKPRKILGFNRREIVRTFVKRKRNSLIFKFCNEKANQSIYIYEIYKKSLHRDFNLTCKICTGCTHVKCSSVRHASLQHGFWEEMRV